MLQDNILAYQGIKPTLGRNVFIAPGSAVIGEVTLGDSANVWFNCTIRGDVNFIRIGASTNVQDNSCIHVSRVTHPTLIGDNVTIGHSVTLHGCIIEDEAFIGMHSCILDGAVVERGGMLAAGSLLTPNKRIKSGELWSGSPAKFMRPMTDTERDFIKISAENYVRLAGQYV